MGAHYKRGGAQTVVGKVVFGKPDSAISKLLGKLGVLDRLHEDLVR